MAVPRTKVTRMKRNQRRAHDAIALIASVECPNCYEPKLPHHVCGACGYYAGREVVAIAAEDEDDDEAA
ncbi:MAG: 50S ribosomal protein L32 [Pseudomonadota bacterium]